jgi:pimeloyl-ACP methyl ester carboxylesterase
MGGMTVLALADQHPELFGDRVIGVALLSTSTGKLAETLFGLPGWALRLARPLLPTMVHAAQRRSAVLERGRRTGTDAGFLTTRFVSFQRTCRRHWWSSWNRWLRVRRWR